MQMEETRRRKAEVPQQVLYVMGRSELQVIPEARRQG